MNELIRISKLQGSPRWLLFGFGLVYFYYVDVESVQVLDVMKLILSKCAENHQADCCKEKACTTSKYNLEEHGLWDWLVSIWKGVRGKLL